MTLERLPRRALAADLELGKIPVRHHPNGIRAVTRIDLTRDGVIAPFEGPSDETLWGVGSSTGGRGGT